MGATLIVHGPIELIKLFQSSPTPKGGRYLRAGRDFPGVIQFQSSPTPKGGRYTTGTGAAGLAVEVSILAHPERWALPLRGVLLRDRCLFQSSPTPKGGRYARIRIDSGEETSFNPRPPRKVGATFVGGSPNHYNFVFQSSPTPKGGRYADSPWPDRVDQVVSILAHPERWALP